MKTCKLIVVHTLDTPEGRFHNAADVIRWHTLPKSQGGRGWKKPGYGELILLDGGVEFLAENDGDEFVDPWEITNGVRGHNAHAYHMAYVGGAANVKKPWMDRYPPKDTRTKEQLITMEKRVKILLDRYPKAKLCGHNQLANRACPSFDVVEWALSIGIPKVRILPRA
jgi:hypothetical protein